MRPNEAQQSLEFGSGGAVYLTIQMLDGLRRGQTDPSDEALEVHGERTKAPGVGTWTPVASACANPVNPKPLDVATNEAGPRADVAAGEDELRMREGSESNELREVVELVAANPVRRLDPAEGCFEGIPIRRTQTPLAHLPNPPRTLAWGMSDRITARAKPNIIRPLSHARSPENLS